MNDELRILLYQYLTLGIGYDIEHYLNRAKENIEDVPSQAQKILELGVGLGRTLFPMLETSAQCYGIDSDRAMLTKAREIAEENPLVHLRLGKIESFLQPHQFAQIQVPLRTLQLLSLSKQAGLLQSAAEHLHPKGELLLHLSSTPENRTDGSWRIYRECPITDGGTMVIEEAVFTTELSDSFFSKQCNIELRHRFQQFNSSGFSTGTWRMAHQLISWTPECFVDFVESCGLKQHNVLKLSDGDWISCCSLA